MRQDLPYYFDDASDDQAINIYLDGYTRNAGVMIPLGREYVAGTSSFLLMHGRHAKGGFCINCADQQPLRYGAPFDPTDWKAALKRKGIAEGNVLEIAAVYTEPDLPAFRKLLFFLEILVTTHQQARERGKGFIIMGTLHEGLAPYIQAVLPKFLYDGFYTINGKRVWLTISVAKTDSLVVRATVHVVQRFILGWLRNKFGSSRRNRRVEQASNAEAQQPSPLAGPAELLARPKGQFYVPKKRRLSQHGERRIWS